MYTLLDVKQVADEDLLGNTGAATQHSTVTQVGEESKKEWIYVYT